MSQNTQEPVGVSAAYAHSLMVVDNPELEAIVNTYRASERKHATVSIEAIKKMEMQFNGADIPPKLVQAISYMTTKKPALSTTIPFEYVKAAANRCKTDEEWVKELDVLLSSGLEGNIRVLAAYARVALHNNMSGFRSQANKKCNAASAVADRLVELDKRRATPSEEENAAIKVIKKYLYVPLPGGAQERVNAINAETGDFWALLERGKSLEGPDEKISHAKELYEKLCDINKRSASVRDLYPKFKDHLPGDLTVPESLKESLSTFGWFKENDMH